MGHDNDDLGNNWQYNNWNYGNWNYGNFYNYPYNYSRERVVIVNYSYVPYSIVVNRGSAVVWVNRDYYPHTVTAINGGFDSGRLNPGERFTMRFNFPGVYYYYCRYHPWMRGIIIVR
jgi:plastocyanin